MGRRILIVDDAEEVRQIYQLAFEGSPIEVQTASSREEAEGLLASGLNPDLILVDLRMPGMSIEEFLEHLRNFNQLQKTRVLAVSSFSKNDLITKSLAIPFFQKPSSLDELIALVESALSHE